MDAKAVIVIEGLPLLHYVFYSMFLTFAGDKNE